MLASLSSLRTQSNLEDVINMSTSSEGRRRKESQPISGLVTMEQADFRVFLEVVCKAALLAWFLLNDDFSAS